MVMRCLSFLVTAGLGSNVNYWLTGSASPDLRRRPRKVYHRKSPSAFQSLDLEDAEVECNIRRGDLIVSTGHHADPILCCQNSS